MTVAIKESVKPVRIVLAGTPMGKQRVRFTHQGARPFTPEKTVNYEGRLAHAAQIVMGGRPLFEGPLEVDLEIRMPIAASRPHRWRIAALDGKVFPTRKPDLDNCAKLLDALNQIVWVDDCQVVNLTLRKLYSDKPGLIAIISPKHTGVFE